MTMSDQTELSPISVSIDNPEDWADISQQLSAELGEPVVLTPEVIGRTVGSAVPMFFAADASGNLDTLRGTFAAQVIAQCQRHIGTLNGDTPESVLLRLVGSPMENGKPALRVHLQIKTRAPDGIEGATGQFWDFALGVQVTVAPCACPNCGAPLSGGQLICDHCHTDVGQVAHAALVVERLELY